MTQYLFISGIGRSGTTALRNSIGLHPQVYYNGFENNIVQDLVAVAKKNMEMQSRRYAMVIPPAKYLKLFRSQLHSLIWPNTWKRLSRRVLVAAVNLTPELPPTLFEIFPNAKVLCLIRNGIGVVSSRMKYQSFKDNEFEDNCRTWLRSVDMARWAGSNSQKARLIRQEWFSDEPVIKAEMNKIFDWLRLKRNDQPVMNLLHHRYHPTSADAQLVDDSQKQDANQQFELARTERWREWTDEQRDWFKSRCGEQMAELDYPMPW